MADITNLDKGWKLYQTPDGPTGLCVEIVDPDGETCATYMFNPPTLAEANAWVSGFEAGQRDGYHNGREAQAKATASALHDILHAVVK